MSLSSSSSNVFVPGTVTVLAGQSGVQFAATVAAVGANEAVTVTAVLNGGAQSATLTLTAPVLPTLTSLACTPSSLAGNQSAACTVSLDKASSGTTTVTLNDDSASLTTPATVSVANGATSAIFTVTAGAIASGQTVTVSATLNGLIRTAQINLVAPTGLSGLTCSPSTFSASGTTTCTITLAAAASSNTIVALASSTANVAVPGSVTVPQGQSGAQFSAAISSVQSDQSVTITASLNGGTQSATLTLVGPTSLTSLACVPGALNSNQSSTCTVTMNKVTTSGVTVLLSDDSAILTTPAGVNIASGTSSGSFTVSAGTVTSNQTATVTASLNGTSKTAQIALTGAPTTPEAATLSNLACTPSTVNPGGSSLCVVTLSAIATSASSVGIATNNDAIALASSVVVPVGSDTAQFRVNIPANVPLQPLLVTASLGLISKSATLTITAPSPGATPAQLSSLACAPSQLNPGDTGVCTIYLKDITDTAASITISANSSSLIVPASAQIPAGAKFQSFTVVVSQSLLNAQDVDINASLNATSVTTRVHLSLGDVQPALSSFDCSLTSITSGGGTVCVISLKSAAPFAGELSLTSNNGLLQIPSRLTVASGAASVSFAIQAGTTDIPVDVTLSAAWFGRNPLTKMITVRPHSITIDVPSATFARVGTTLGFDVKVTHSGGLGTDLIALGLPTGASLRGTRFSWTPTDAQVGETSVSFRATDANGLFGTAAARVAIRPAQPIITGLYNPAGYAPIESCSPNAIVTFLGSGFSLHDPMEAGPGAWPTELAGVRIRINGVYAPITFVSDTTVHFQCPASDPGASLEIVMEYEAATPTLSTGAAATGTVSVAPIVVRMTGATPGLYLIKGSQGAVLISGTGLIAGPPVSSLTGEGYPARSVLPGEYLEIYANGLGSTTETLGPGKPAPLDHLIRLSGTVTAIIGDGMRVPVAFAGLTPNSVGLFQINIQVPAGAPVGDAVPLSLELAREDGTVVRSNTVTIGIAAGR
jgi:trimeric autotransporter adhesin